MAGLVTDTELDAWLSEGRFATVVMWGGSPKLGALGFPRLYARREQLDGFEVFWDRVLK